MGRSIGWQARACAPAVVFVLVSCSTDGGGGVVQLPVGGMGAMWPAGAAGAAAAGTSAPPVAGSFAPPSAPGTGTQNPGGGAPPVQGGAGGSVAPPAQMPTVELAPDYYGTVTSPAAIAPECQGFKLDGLRYSPGGSVLPNRCEPFDATTNNPYAVRCIDAWTHYQTAFPGDEYCILPPHPDLGVQYGAHPHAAAWFEQAAAGDLSGYDGAADEWVMQAGEEETINFRTSSSNTQEHNYYRAYYRMRSGSHHNIITSHDDPDAPREVWLPGSSLPGSIDPFLGPLITGLGGAQRPDENVPHALEKPAEDQGLYRVFPTGAAIIMNMHHFNFTSGETLKEAWVNVFWEEDATVPVRSVFGLDIAQVGLTMPANTTRDLHYYFAVSEPLRVVNVFGHRHSWTPNFSAWVERAGGGEPEIIYQSFDWFDVPTYRYDSATQNPPPNPEARSDGGSSGVLELAAGDELHFNCHISFTDARAAAVNAGPSATEIGTLRFANEAYDAEMCILFGGTAHGELPDPVSAPAAEVPDFAKLE